MLFTPNKSGTVALDGSGQQEVKLVEGQEVDLPEHLVSFLTKCGWKQEEVEESSEEEVEESLEDKINAFKKISDAKDFAEANEIELESTKLADIKKELLEKLQ